jgi:peptidyl-prolyl cis-trans isomerase SurA
MQVGELSEAIRNGSGFHVIKLLNKRGAGVQSTKQTKVNHILVLPNEIRTPNEAQALIEELHQRLVNGAQFYDLARAFSDDANSSANGGDLGWINDGQLPKILQDQVNALADGELSAPIENMNGWHLVQVVERRTKDVGNENLRFQAKRALTQSKFSNELENWLREIRNEAYVEIR